MYAYLILYHNFAYSDYVRADVEAKSVEISQLQNQKLHKGTCDLKRGIIKGWCQWEDNKNVPGFLKFNDYPEK